MNDDADLEAAWAKIDAEISDLRARGEAAEALSRYLTRIANYALESKARDGTPIMFKVSPERRATWPPLRLARELAITTRRHADAVVAEGSRPEVAERADAIAEVFDALVGVLTFAEGLSGDRDRVAELVFAAAALGRADFVLGGARLGVFRAFEEHTTHRKSRADHARRIAEARSARWQQPVLDFLRARGDTAGESAVRVAERIVADSCVAHLPDRGQIEKVVRRWRRDGEAV